MIRNVCIMICGFIHIVGCAPTNNISSFSASQEFSRNHKHGLVLLALEKGHRIRSFKLKIDAYDSHKKELRADCDEWNRVIIDAAGREEDIVQSYLMPPGDYLLRGTKSCTETLGCGYMFSIVSGQAIGLRLVPNADADGEISVVPFGEKQKGLIKSSLPLLTTPIDPASLQWIGSLPFNAIMCAP